MRTNSSRQVVGSDTVCWYAGKPPAVRPEVGWGTVVSSALPTAVGVIVLLGKGVPLAGCGQSGPGQTSLKFPPRSARDGTFTMELPLLPGGDKETFFSRRHSSEKKKKVFFLFEL